MCKNCDIHKKKLTVAETVRKGIKFAEESGEGVWRTIKGSPVFIKEGQSVEEAIAAKFGKGGKVPVQKEEFGNLIKQLPKEKFIVGDAVEKAYGIGGEGGDLTYKAKSTFKEMGYIIDESPELIQDVPLEEKELFLEFLKQNNGPAYKKTEPWRKKE